MYVLKIMSNKHIDTSQSTRNIHVKHVAIRNARTLRVIYVNSACTCRLGRVSQTGRCLIPQYLTNKATRWANLHDRGNKSAQLLNYLKYTSKYKIICTKIILTNLSFTNCYAIQNTCFVSTENYIEIITDTKNSVGLRNVHGRNV